MRYRYVAGGYKFLRGKLDRDHYDDTGGLIDREN